MLVGLSWAGCVAKVSIRRPPVIAPEQAKPIETDLHLLGVWENAGRGGKTKRLIFESGGTLKFEGGLDYFNPGKWELDSARRELKITLPDADDDKLQIFQLYVGDGVKAFDRACKRITYFFDDQTWSLNVGGWQYSKNDGAALPDKPEAEPVFTGIKE